MSRIDALPADQKAVLQLLLRQGKGYDDLSSLLRLEPDAVRTRAYDALDALGPGPGGLSAEHRHGLADWLLGQQGPDEAQRTLAFLQTSPGGRSWARSVAGELRPLGGDRLPAVPADHAATNGAPAADALPAQAPPAPEPSAAPAPDAAADEPTGFAPAPTAAPRVSRKGGAMLLAGALTVVVIGVVGYLLLHGGSDKKSDGPTASTSTPATATPQVQAQANLLPPKDAPAKKAVGIVQIVSVSNQLGLNAVAQGLPVSKSAAYGIWLYGGTSKFKLVGGFNKTDNKGHLIYQGALSGDLTPYDEILVTRETTGSPKRPGRVYLRGTIGAPSANSTGTG